MSDRPTPETDAQIRNQNDAFDDWEKYRLTIIFARKLERERDEAREAFRKTIEGVIDGGDTKEGYLMVQVPVPPTGYRVGQVVKVLLPEKEAAK